jgi:hypothetical protein
MPTEDDDSGGEGDLGSGLKVPPEAIDLLILQNLRELRVELRRSSWSGVVVQLLRLVRERAADPVWPGRTSVSTGTVAVGFVLVVGLFGADRAWELVSWARSVIPVVSVAPASTPAPEVVP